MSQAQTGRKVILVVDDNLVFQKATSIKLRAFGYDVITAEDGSAADSPASHVPVKLRPRGGEGVPRRGVGCNTRLAAGA
jgi:response regulator RpfG family c-di-GMP phosphodiesterase